MSARSARGLPAGPAGVPAAPMETLRRVTLPRVTLLLVTLLLVTLLLVTLASPAVAQQVQLEERVFELARDLRCPACVSESVADSAAPIAVEMRSIIQEKLEAGESEEEIVAFFVARYGDWILLDPPKRGLHLLVWLLPLIAALGGGAALTLYVRRWLAASRQPIDVDEADLQRVRDALASGAPSRDAG